MTDQHKRAQLVARISNLQADLDEAEWELREHDRVHPPPPYEGPYCVRSDVKAWMDQLEPSKTPLLTKLRGVLR